MGGRNKQIYLSNNAQPFLPFFNLYPLLDWDKRLERGNNSYTKFSAIHDWHCPRDTYYTPSASSNGEVQLVQVESKNSPHPRVATRPVDDNISAVSRVGGGANKQYSLRCTLPLQLFGGRRGRLLSLYVVNHRQRMTETFVIRNPCEAVDLYLPIL